MIASLFILSSLAVLSVNGQFSALNGGGNCYFIADMLPADPQCKIGFTRSAPGKTSPIKGYWIKDKQGFYKRHSNPECAGKLTNSMYIKKNGRNFIMGTKRNMNNNNAEFPNCTPGGVCTNNYNVGSQYSKYTYPKVKVVVMKLPDSQCNNLKGQSYSANAVDEEDDTEADWAMLADAAQAEQAEADADIDIDAAQQAMSSSDEGSSSEDEVTVTEEEEMAHMDGAAEFDVPNEPLEFGQEFDYKPQPAGNDYTISVDKWSLLVMALVFANIAIIMTILYCRQKAQNEKVETF